MCASQYLVCALLSGAMAVGPPTYWSVLQGTTTLVTPGAEELPQQVPQRTV